MNGKFRAGSPPKTYIRVHRNKPRRHADDGVTKAPGNPRGVIKMHKPLTSYLFIIGASAVFFLAISYNKILSAAV